MGSLEYQGWSTPGVRNSTRSCVVHGSLRWFGHVQKTGGEQRRPRVMTLALPGCQTTGTHNEDMETADLRGQEGGRDMTLDRTEWRRTRPTPYR